MPIFSLDLFGFHIAPTWYGLMYAIGFMSGYIILRKRKILSEKELESLVLYVFFGVILGGRLGYVLFYNLPYYLDNPARILATWQGGMSFHGGVIGVIVAMILFARRNLTPYLPEGNPLGLSTRGEGVTASPLLLQKEKGSGDEVKKSVTFLFIADHITSVLPIGLGLGRIGNYINGELLGFANYTGPFAVVKNGVSHFPSPLLEATLEGVVLFSILWYLRKTHMFPGKIATSFLIWYGVFRFSIEFFRTPDANLGYLTLGLTMGQILSIPMILAGMVLFQYFQRKREKQT